MFKSARLPQGWRQDSHTAHAFVGIPRKGCEFGPQVACGIIDPQNSLRNTPSEWYNRWLETEPR